MCDPNLSGRIYTTAVIAPDINSANTSFDGTAFEGLFDGSDYTISNLKIDGGGYLGLFGYISGGEIKDLGLVNISVTGSDQSKYIGGLCGENYHGTINDCYTTGSVGTGDYSMYIGGLCGENYRGTISDCYANGSVNAGVDSNFIGGLCGLNFDVGNINSCYATVSVSAGVDSLSIGGLCGGNYEYSNINNCYATGSVTCGAASMRIGGLCGQNHYGISTGGIRNCYATGSVSAGVDSYHLGGLSGNNYYGVISNCYATGSVTGSYNLGGLCGIGSFTSISNSFWDFETGGPDNGYGTPKTTLEMKTKSTFTDASWDFVNETDNGILDIWRLCADGVQYPTLNQQNPAGDFACPDGVWLEDLLYFITYWLDDTLNPYEGGDLTGEGDENLADFAIFGQNWLSP